MPSSLEERTALASLKALLAFEGRQMFPVAGNKRPLHSARPDRLNWDWKTEPFTDKELIEFWRQGYRLGVKPSSLGLWVADVDQGIEESWGVLCDKFVAPLTFPRTAGKNKGFHAYYSLPKPCDVIVGNHKWRFGKTGGELRGHNGYVVIWDIEATLKAAQYALSAEGNSPYPLFVEERFHKAEDEPGREAPNSGKPGKRLEEAVTFLDREKLGATPPYDEWITIGQAIHWETGGHVEGYRLWDRWSQNFENYPGVGEPTTAAKWRSFNSRDDGVTGGSVYNLAESLGWNEDLTEEFDELPDVAPETPEREETRNKAKSIRPVYTDQRIWTLKKIYRTMGIKVRLNIRSQCLEFSRNGEPWYMPSDGNVISIREYVAQHFLLKTPKMKAPDLMTFTKQGIDELNSALADENQVDPFMEWLESLDEWDGAERLSSWIENSWNLTDDNDPDLLKWSSRFILLGAIYRAYEPGCLLDEMPVLIGKGGLGKSKALRFLFPPEHQHHWFVDRFDFMQKEKEQAEKTMTSVIAEASEMAGVRKATNNHIKSSLSGTVEVVRLAYRRNPSSLARRCIIVGTADTKDVLPNDDNLRRFVTVVFGPGSAMAAFKYINENRDQLWAEALALFRKKTPAWLPPDLAERQNEINQNFRGRDEAVEDLVSRVAAEENDNGYSLHDLMDTVGCDIRYSRVFGIELKRAGWTKRKDGPAGQRRNRWFAPQDWTPAKGTPYHSISHDFEDLDIPDLI